MNITVNNAEWVKGKCRVFGRKRTITVEINGETANLVFDDGMFRGAERSGKPTGDGYFGLTERLPADIFAEKDIKRAVKADNAYLASCR